MVDRSFVIRVTRRVNDEEGDVNPRNEVSVSSPSLSAKGDRGSLTRH